ncbi:DUF1345 domain-containing protein [Novosphingobium ginsenosidimutans]|uniref:DUF1345 domain-containing protein n=1 Tax=Novosphingobium ginsenosidimutans TaxID=1176536 RepID=A0A5B8S4Y9_9SPHN|nr:DUF1345 domain-containing protein [Novosphingobium ginsenosidimutans]QEA15495.1 DUF1345 domain-containing protein [Novosphingobium ginsenosidimutans]
MTGPAKTLGNRLAPPRFIAFALLLPVGAGLWAWLNPVAPWQDALAMGFDLAAAVFLLSLLPLLRHFPVAEMRRHADENDANRTLIVVVSTLLALVVMAAISGELAAASAGDGLAMGKLLVTLVLAWLFANSVYALHYAHSYYFGSEAKGDHRGGIEFPGTPNPDYSDFAYFAFTVGMTFQTSDVQITAPAVRRLVLVQSLASFVFNIGVIAFTINALG